jgi:hypothetical protein
MIQSDMIGYHKPDEPPQLAQPNRCVIIMAMITLTGWSLPRFAVPEVLQLVANVSAIYSPELAVGFTSVCRIRYEMVKERSH